MSSLKSLRVRASLAVFGLAACALLLLPPFTFPTATASHTPAPTSVTVAGSLQSELGCPGDWQPECGATHLGYDADDDVWQGTFNVPAGNWEYKAAQRPLGRELRTKSTAERREHHALARLNSERQIFITTIRRIGLRATATPSSPSRP